MMYSVVPRRVLSTVYSGEFTIHSFGKLPTLTISSLPRHCFRCYCRSSAAATVSPAGVSSLVAERERQVIRSTELVAMEYAELNLTDKFCEVKNSTEKERNRRKELIFVSTHCFYGVWMKEANTHSLHFVLSVLYV